MAITGTMVRWFESHQIGPDIGHIPVSNLYEVFILFCWLTTLFYLYYEQHYATQALGAFNDSLFKQAVVLFVTYQLYSDSTKEAQFSAIAQGLFILPFFLLSAASGQLADIRDKARLIRIVKAAAIGIMIVGGIGLAIASVPLMLTAVFAKSFRLAESCSVTTTCTCCATVCRWRAWPSRAPSATTSSRRSPPRQG